ncbi:MAG: RsmD family RNA methyltransferase, partial [Actinomycetes bacterium]
EALLGGLGGCVVLDLYAGSGALGLEALSRGARSALLVEADRAAAGIAVANARRLGLPGAQVLVSRVEQLVARPPADLLVADVVLADPPYDLAAEAVRGVLVGMARHGWLAPWAIVALERSERDPEFAWPDGFQPDRSRRYGQARVWFARWSPPWGPAPLW